MVDRSAHILRRAVGRLSMGTWLPVVRRMDDGRTVGLTFDDGPTPETTPALVRLFREHRATATFFLTGVRVAAAPDLVRQLVEAGHAVFAHGWEHVRYDQQPASRLLADLERTEALLRQFRPTPCPYLVRLPYAAGLAESWVHRAIREWSPAAQFAHWDYSPDDWTLANGCGSATEVAEACATAVAKALRRRRFPGSIVLLHEDPFDVAAPLIRLVTPTLVSLLLTALRERGLRAEAMSSASDHTRLRAYVRG